jgi:hypothetical protein
MSKVMDDAKNWNGTRPRNRIRDKQIERGRSSQLREAPPKE